MITNEKQYRITRKKVLGFAHAIEEFDVKSDNRADVHPRLVQAEREAIESQLEDLREELEEYEQLKSAEVSVISVGSFEELADGLIKARIAGGSQPAGACATSGDQGTADPTIRGGALCVRKLPATVPGSVRHAASDRNRNSTSRRAG